jgi:hypothetical protein
MASTHLNEPDQRPNGGDPLAEYLATVSARLPGPTAARTTITDELRDGLLEALEADQAQGRSPQEATAAAIADFGDRRIVAAAIAPELAAAQARRVALGLLATGPLIGLAWIAAVAVNALPPWHHQLTGPWLALPVVDLTLLAILGGQTLASSRLPVWAPVIVAASASLVRITLAGAAARRCLATRAALP